MDTWKAPLDEFTLRYLMARLVEDREKHLADAQEVRKYDDTAAESFMVRAEECGRIIKQLKKLIGINSTPPPPQRNNQWP